MSVLENFFLSSDFEDDGDCIGGVSSKKKKKGRRKEDNNFDNDR